jgi:hypothetical protein
MIRKVIATLFVIASLLFYLLTLYNNIPQDPISMSASQIMPTQVAMINYGLTPVFAENLRFNHNNISYSINPECSETRKESMINAFGEFEKEMGIISFYNDDINADIKIECSDKQINVGDNLFAAGEGGPSRIINTSSFRTIEEGKIYLYDDQRCDYPIVELHELLHVFGFDHIENPTSIMYNISRCNQRITPDMIRIINSLYSIEPLPDAKIEKLEAVKRGRYLDFNITVLNEGMQKIDDINLTITVGDKIIQVIRMEEIDIGYGRELEAKNIKLPSVKTESVVFTVDYYDNIKEHREDNNQREMSVQPQ